MKSKFYFQAGKVHSITLTPERESGYEWFEAIPEQSKKFLGFTIGTIPSVPAGWSDYEDGRLRKESSYFEQYSWYRVDEVNKKVFNKANISIRFNYKESYGMNFNSNEEAQQWIDDLIKETGLEFSVIVNK